MRKLLSFLTIIFLLLPSNRVASAAPKAQTGTSVQVTVAITRVVELNCDEDFGEACPNDYYPKFQIGGKELFDGKDDFCCAHPEGDPPEFSTSDWKRTEEVDSSQNPVQIHVELWDQDDLSADDELDIGSGSPRSLDVTFNLSTCTVQGIVMVPGAPPATSQGNDADSARIYYTVTTPLCQDGDTDGLLDSWEILGYDADGNGTIDVDLPTMGANSQRKDLFLEIDCLAVLGGHSHCPVSGAIQTVVQSFANAPVANVDGTRGIQLHVDIGGLYNYPALPAAGFATNVPRTEAPAGSVTGNFGNFGGGGDRIAEAGNLIVDWDGANGNPATNFFTLKTANFNSQRDPIFRYGLFVHQTNYRQASNDCTSGWAKGIPGVNFIVSLGGTNAGNPAAVPPVPPAPCWAADASGNSVGNQNQQAGTLMHEFGHTLGLRHGGGQNFNNKPNYLSVMNYGIATGPAATPGSVQFCNVPALGGNPGGCDYSRAPLLTLDEVNPPGLDECAGIGLGLGGFDWDGAGGLTGQTCVPASGNTSANVNGDFNDLNNNNVQDAGESNILSQLNGYDDWNNIFYPFNTLPNYQTAGTPVEDEADPATLARLQAILAEQVRPVLNVDKTGPTDAIPGDTLNYSIKVTNSGRGPALNAVLTDTKPDSTQAVFNLGTLVVGAEATHDVSFSVPCSVTDLTILKNSATATAKDILGNPVSGSDVVDITVHTPVLTLSKTATASVNAGEAITYTITYENTGSGEAENVVITDVLPAGVYYSQALDLGAGPKPDTMTLNPDGTRTLTWNIGAVPANSGPKTIAFTARPTLLALGGTSYSNNVSLSFQNSNGCVYDALNAAASTIITVVTPTRDPLTLGFWRTHPEQWTAEFLARIQATDQRYDNDGDGALSVAEATALLASGGNQPKVLQMQLLATYLNLATRRINANTTISSKTAANLGLINVRDAALFAIDTLLLPVNQATAAQYDNATRVLDEINNNKSEVY
jgi:uncharacterized repeat protein (TIGR01451 family)